MIISREVGSDMVQSSCGGRPEKKPDGCLISQAESQFS
jgi:hypothetical protein